MDSFFVKKEGHAIGLSAARSTCPKWAKIFRFSDIRVGCRFESDR